MSFFNIYDSLPRSSLASFDSIIPPKLHRRVMRAISMGPNLHEKNSLLPWEIAIDFIPKHPNARLSILPSCQCIVTLLSHQVTHPCCQPIPSLLSIYNFETVFHIPSSHLNLSPFLGTTPPLHYMLTAQTSRPQANQSVSASSNLIDPNNLT